MNPALLATVIASLGALVTAIATIALWRATGVLAKETSRMADATGQGDERREEGGEAERATRSHGGEEVHWCFLPFGEGFSS